MNCAVRYTITISHLAFETPSRLAGNKLTLARASGDERARVISDVKDQLLSDPTSAGRRKMT